MSDRPSGMELMLRTAGLGPMLDMGKQLAEAGAVDKIMAFADKVEKIDFDEINNRLERIERLLAGSTVEHGSGPAAYHGNRLRLTGVSEGPLERDADDGREDIASTG